jgi:hypothetical protein
MAPGGNRVVIFTTLNNIRDRSAIDLEIGGNVPAEICYPDHNESTTWFGGAVG